MLSKSIYKKGNQKPVPVVGYRNFKHSISGEDSRSLRDALYELGESVSFSYKYCPDLKADPLSLNAAKAVLAAEIQQKGEEVYQALMLTNQAFTKSLVFELAGKAGLDMVKFGEAFKSKKISERLYADISDSEQCGLTLFPGLTINDTPYNGIWDNTTVIAEIKKQAGKQRKFSLESFFQWKASAALVLVAATILALTFVNLGWQESYEHWKHMLLGFMAGEGSFGLPLEKWINDFLMAIFFLAIGLEIKQEIISGELSDSKRAAMPVIGAIGGMLVPALIYFLINTGTETHMGWGIPMATDIAFALGLMAVLGKRVPLALKIFISALAVADDLGAIVVIALFYGHGFHLEPFLGGLVIMLVMFLMNRGGIYKMAPYLILGLLLWVFIFQSGLHATLAGVITAFLIPLGRKRDVSLLARQTNIIFDHELNNSRQNQAAVTGLGNHAIKMLKNAVAGLREPGVDLHHALEKWVNYLILPLFAFFNTGILLSGIELDMAAPVNMGIIAGLLIGKPLGIVGFCWLAAKLKWAQLSEQINWPMLVGASSMAGIGFTMSIVVASSAFGGEVLTFSKVSILITSTIAAVIGLTILAMVTRKKSQPVNTSLVRMIPQVTPS